MELGRNAARTALAQLQYENGYNWDNCGITISEASIQAPESNNAHAVLQQQQPS